MVPASPTRAKRAKPASSSPATVLVSPRALHTHVETAVLVNIKIPKANRRARLAVLVNIKIPTANRRARPAVRVKLRPPADPRKLQTVLIAHRGKRELAPPALIAIFRCIRINRGKPIVKPVQIAVRWVINTAFVRARSDQEHANRAHDARPANTSRDARPIRVRESARIVHWGHFQTRRNKLPANH
jgi:hypothetical protein